MSRPAGARAYHHGALRPALIAAAEAVIAERGVDGFSLRETARRAGVSPAAPAHHFGDARGPADRGRGRGLPAVRRRARSGRRRRRPGRAAPRAGPGLCPLRPGRAGRVRPDVALCPARSRRSRLCARRRAGPSRSSTAPPVARARRRPRQPTIRSRRRSPAGRWSTASPAWPSTARSAPKRAPPNAPRRLLPLVLEHLQRRSMHPRASDARSFKPRCRRLRASPLSLRALNRGREHGDDCGQRTGGPAAPDDYVVDPKRDRLVIVASSLGTVFEWYDFFIYGTLARRSSPRTSSRPATRLPPSCSPGRRFGVGFGVRPLGAILFGYLGDRLGRKYTFLVTITLMGVATAAVGLLPTYAADRNRRADPARHPAGSLQGLALGGEYGGAAIYVAEHAPPQQARLLHQLHPGERDRRLPAQRRGRARVQCAGRPPRPGTPGAGASPSSSRCCCSRSRSGCG